ncbi:MAG: hypothetical protein HY465_02635 [Deltaproteobacteria bacterium]|nr:hypothetical protein [Deltaproteobacteria bacterium]
MSVRRLIVVVLFLIAFPFSLQAAHVPPITIAPDEWSVPAEDTLRHLRDQRVRTTKPSSVFWKSVVDLKQTLLSLPPTARDENIDAEADRLAKTIISTLYQLSQEYRVFVSPRLHNMAIKLGLRKKGYCYHYAHDLRQVLATQPWSFFSFAWVEGNAGTSRESNAIALFRRGQSFETGIVVDPWRTGSKPYWRAVKGDRWPWQEWNGTLAADYDDPKK